MNCPPFHAVALNVAGERDEIARLQPEETLLFDGDYRGRRVEEDIAMFSDIVVSNWPWFVKAS